MSLFFEVKMIDEPKDHELKYGKEINFPPNMKEISETEFSQSMFFIYTPKIYEWRQTQESEAALKKFGFKHSPILHMYHLKTSLNDGFIIVNDYWERKIRYFTFASCNHEFVENGSRMCLHRSKCKKCGFEWEVDSSD